ncbi:hypothetical protein OJF2_45330 [Aquisphaera giovannonii]|uniref:Uncharacterized protein n=1 Tax=Aquisphaera giovannonii TaxID=406548 RepID=A0A5B9W7B1_9BACT|nr:hypothetical protein [Aquisphaera giovannonii]QEH35975.1 hypothetical protein OJF2_45330 [Aquisphaera giovannonii]
MYAPLGELKVYELSEAEFDRLAEGASGQLHLNFALAMLPTALSVLISLLTTTIESNRVYLAFLVAFWALLVQGLISLLRWWLYSRTHRKRIEGSRARMPVRPVIAEQITPASPMLDVEPAGPPAAGDAADSRP